MIRMTAKEAEKILFNMADYVEFDEDYGVLFRAPLVDATVRAVKALREEVVHGRWMGGYKNRKGRWLYTKPCCSVCSFEQERISNYCPNCGAKMDLEDKE